MIAAHHGDIISVEIVNPRHTYFEIELPGDSTAIIGSLRELPIVQQVEQVDTMEKIYGKRNTSWAAARRSGKSLSARSPRSRPGHNIRGEHISVDYRFRWWAKSSLADVVRAAAQPPRVKAVVLAGSLIGTGEPSTPVREVRAQGLLVVSSNT